MSQVVHGTIPTAPKRGRRLRWLGAVGGLLILAVAAYIHFFLYLPMGSGPAGPAVEAPFDQPWTEQQVLLVGLGDSVTAGFGATQGKSFFDRLLQNPADEFAAMQGRCLSRVLPNVEALNLAISGSNSLQHLNHVEQRLPQQVDNTFGLVVMTTGGNDLIHWYGQTPPREGAMYGATFTQAEPWIDNYRLRLSTIFQAIEDRFPGGCLIFVGDIYDPSDGLGDPESTWALPAWSDCLRIHAAYNEALRQAAAKFQSVHVVPVHETFLGHGIHCRKFWTPHFDRRDPHYWYFENIEDPNDRGYDALRRVFLRAIAEQRHRITEHRAAAADLQW
jgi:lysophospholipase L1-like esterase